VGSAVRGPWTGPPLLLIAVTVLGFAVAPLVSSPDDASAGEPQGQVQLSSGDPSYADDGERITADAAERDSPKPGSEIAPIPRQVVGVATFNVFRQLTYDEMVSDARTLGGNDAIDIIGWQEAWDSAAVFGDLHQRGWTTKRFPKGAKELAVSWRRDEFAFVGADQRLVARGVSDEDGRYPFGDRYAIRVTLKDKATGELISVLDTHLPQAIEDLDRPGRWRPTYNAARARLQLTRMAQMWDRAPGRWVVGTGDYNVDVDAETRIRPDGGISKMFAGRAVSSYAVLGKDLAPTHPVSGRHIDYVHASRQGVRSGEIEFLTQRVISGLNSDHRALLVRFALT
jgi:hypothetical protein